MDVGWVERMNFNLYKPWHHVQIAPADEQKALQLIEKSFSITQQLSGIFQNILMS